MVGEPAHLAVEELARLFDLTGQVVMITGGSGVLGSALTRGFAVYGADLVLLDLEEPRESILREITYLGRKSLSLVCDVTDEAAVQAAVETATEQFGRIDVLVTAAGYANRYPAETFPLEEWQKIMDTNLRGTWICCKAVGARMIEQRHGKIITIGSVRGFLGHPGGYAGYGPSKGAVHLLTKQLATEWAKHQINVNCIAPAVFWTPLSQPILDDPALRQLFLSRIPLARAAEADEFVGAAVYLASRASDFTTGHILSVDGGAVAG